MLLIFNLQLRFSLLNIFLFLEKPLASWRKCSNSATLDMESIKCPYKGKKVRVISWQRVRDKPIRKRRFAYIRSSHGLKPTNCGFPFSSQTLKCVYHNVCVHASPPPLIFFFWKFSKKVIFHQYLPFSFPWTHFDTNLVRKGCYGYEIWRQK